MAPLSPVLLFSLLLLLLPKTCAETFSVSSEDDLDNALSEAGAGDVISLADGVYSRALITVRGGEEGDPLTIVGGRDAVINGGSDGRVVLVRHSWVTLKGFSVDARISDEDEWTSYAVKGVYVEGPSDSGDSLLEGFVMTDLDVRNCGGECVRLKNFVVGAEISDNTISDCGIRDYIYDAGGENGEGIYVGTSSSQWSDGPDICRDNVIKDNTIVTNGNECVDIKEGSTWNIVQGNTCQGQLDSDSGCFNCRGDTNVFRYNTASDCAGSGVRVGGWEIDGYAYGVDNSVYDNEFVSTMAGAINVQRLPQGKICDNSCEDGRCEVVGDGEGTEIEETWDQDCPLSG